MYLVHKGPFARKDGRPRQGDGEQESQGGGVGGASNQGQVGPGLIEPDTTPNKISTSSLSNKFPADAKRGPHGKAKIIQNFGPWAQRPLGPLYGIAAALVSLAVALYL